jgi:hypothetical protein
MVERIKVLNKRQISTPNMEIEMNENFTVNPISDKI